MVSSRISRASGVIALKGNDPHSIICVAGPTATGKTELAQRIAESFHGVVLSADSMQIYKGMDIGTGKIRPDEMRVPHFGIDLVDPGEPYSAALYQEYARRVLDTHLAENIPCVVCGGTGFYIRAALDDFAFPPGDQVGNDIRNEMNAYAAEYGAHALWEKLWEKDPESAAIIPENDVKRVVRAFELMSEGESYAAQRERFAAIQPFYGAIYVGLHIEPEVLARRIDERVDTMVADGLVEEVEGLLDKGFREGITAPAAIGYKEIVDALDGRCSLDEAIDRIKIATHRYAKRQRTWFRKDKRITWIDATSLTSDEVYGKALESVMSR